MDINYYKYVCQDCVVKDSKGTKYALLEENAYRTLFAKDVFFKGEQEYRFVLPDEKINERTPYPVKLSQHIEVKNLEDFFDEM